MAIDIQTLGVTGQQIRVWLENQEPMEVNYYGMTTVHHFLSYMGNCRLTLPQTISMEEKTFTEFGGTFADSDCEVATLTFHAKEGQEFTCRCGEFHASEISIKTTMSKAIAEILQVNGLTEQVTTF